jgi:hypothetical protein
MANIITIPSSPADLKKLKDGIDELTNSMARVDGEKDYQKESIETLAENFNVDKKYIRRIAVESHRDTFEKKSDEQENFEQLYESVMAAS